MRQIQVLDSPQKNSFLRLCKDYEIQNLESKDFNLPNLYVYLGYNSKSLLNISSNEIPILIGVLPNSELEELKKLKNPILMAPVKAFSVYCKESNLPVYEMIHKCIIFSILCWNPEIKSNLINIDSEIHKLEKQKIKSINLYTKDNITYMYNSFTDLQEITLFMSWIIYQNLLPTNSVYTLIDIDSDIDLKNLLPLTILGIYQKGFMINLENKSAEKIYKSLMGFWNNIHYIPKRKQLLQPDILTQKLSRKKFDFDFNPNFEETIKKPPIFIIDSILESLKFCHKQNTSNKIILFFGNWENFEKIIQD